MTPAARLSAAIDVLANIDTQRVPAPQALKEWGTAHRFAGSGDRAAIAGLVWDVLRRRASAAFLMDADTPRARLLGMLKLERGMDAGVTGVGAEFDAQADRGPWRRLRAEMRKPWQHLLAVGF